MTATVPDREPVTREEAARMIRRAVVLVLTVQVLLIAVLSPVGIHVLTSRWFWIPALILIPCVLLGWFTRDGRRR